MRIKTFSNGYIEDTEEEVNNWLETERPLNPKLFPADGGLTIVILYGEA